MKACARQKQINRWFDGEVTENDSLHRHIETCPQCARYLRFLEATRRSVQAAPKPSAIADAQLPAFLDGIQRSIHATPSHRRFTGLWALASVACAAIIASASIFYIVTGGPAPATAEIVVETHGTEIEGATTRFLQSGDGATTLWVDVPQDAWEYQPEGDMM